MNYLPILQIIPYLLNLFQLRNVDLILICLINIENLVTKNYFKILLLHSKVTLIVGIMSKCVGVPIYHCRN